MKSKKRKSLSLRLQPYEGTPLASVVDYLNSMDKDGVSKLVGEILVMCLLPYARMDSSHAYTDSQLRLTCLESCDALDKHASTMRQALMVEQPKFSGQTLVSSTNSFGIDEGAVGVKRESLPEIEKPSFLLSGKGSSKEVDEIFGD